MISISVIIPAFNAERTILEALESVRAQTYAPLEIIVVNDGSTDATADCVQRHFDDVQLITTENKGVAHARNTGIYHALADYVAFLDADDIWCPDHLAHAAEFFGKHNDVAWYSSAFSVQSASGSVSEVVLKSKSETVDFFKNTLSRSFICTPAVVISRAALLQAGLFNTGWRFGEDLNLWVRIALNNPSIGYCPVPGCLIRRTQGSATFDKRNYWMKNTIRALYFTSAHVENAQNEDARRLMAHWAEDAAFSAVLGHDVFSVCYLRKRWKNAMGWMPAFTLCFHRLLPRVLVRVLNKANKRRRIFTYRLNA